MEGMKYDKCRQCLDYQFVTEKNRNQICYRCDLEYAKEQLIREFEQSRIYKMMIKALDWLERVLERF